MSGGVQEEQSSGHFEESPGNSLQYKPPFWKVKVRAGL